MTVKKKLAIFSPLPPTKSGISDYSIDLGLALSEYFDITFVIDNDALLPDNNLIKFAEIVKLSQWYKKNRKGHLIFYQMGNNAYHNYIYDEVIKHPGFVLLHDYSIHHLMLDRSQNNHNEYSKLLKKAKEVHNDLSKYTNNQFCLPDLFKFILPLNDLLIEKSSGVIVHSESSFNKIKEKYPSKSLLQINFPVTSVQQMSQYDLINLRSKYRINSSDFIISSFGFVTPTKQIPLILQSLSLIKNDLKNFKYLLVGEVHTSINITELINKFNLNKHVEVIGYTDLLVFEEYIKLSDLIITLRYPSAGETSAVLLRALAHGKANIVFDYDSFGDFPDEVLLKIPLDTSDPFFLAESIKSICCNKDLKKSYETNAEKYIRNHHDFKKITEQLTNFLTTESMKNSFIKLDFKKLKKNINLRIKTHSPKDDIGVSAFLHKNKLWEPFETSLFIKLINKKENFIDVGANIGYYSLLGSKLMKSGSMIYSFEPELKNITLFKENIKENKAQNVILFENACSNNNDPIYLSLSKNNLGDHRVSKNKNSKNKKILPIVLDDVYKKFKFIPDLVKIDTQGYEFNVLSGSQSLLSQSNRKTIFLIEFWPKGLQDQNHSLDKLINLINKEYFSFFAIFEENRTIFNIDIAQLLDWSKTIMKPSTDRYMNIIFGHSSNKEIKALKLKSKQKLFKFNKKNYAVNRKNSLSNYLIPLGWSYPEQSGVWTNGHFSKILIDNLVIKKNKKYSLSFKIYISDKFTKIPYFNLNINDNFLQCIKPHKKEYIEYKITIPSHSLAKTSVITFENFDIVDMSKLINEQCPREICFFLQYFMITEDN